MVIKCSFPIPIHIRIHIQLVRVTTLVGKLNQTNECARFPIAGVTRMTDEIYIGKMLFKYQQ